LAANNLSKGALALPKTAQFDERLLEPTQSAWHDPTSLFDNACEHRDHQRIEHWRDEMWYCLFVVAVSQSVISPTVELEAISLAEFVKATPNQARGITLWFEQDRGNLQRTYRLPWGSTHNARFLKFYTNWADALAALDTTHCNDETKAELDGLFNRVNNLKAEFMKQATERDRLKSRVPFAGLIAELDDARRRANTLDAEKAAATLNRLKKEILAAHDAVETDAKANPLPEATTRGTLNALDELRQALRDWSSFYAGYDPLFDWWCKQPMKEADAALQHYVTTLKAVRTSNTEVATPATVTDTIAVGSGPSDVPDLKQLLSEPTNEMIPVLRRYQIATDNRQSGGRTTELSLNRMKAYLQGLKTIDFDKLSRAAQVDYLLFQNHLQSQVKRAELRAKLGQPKLNDPDASGIRGRPIGTEQLAADLAMEMIPYTPEELIGMAEAEYKWCLVEMKKASREMGFEDDWKQALEKVKSRYVAPGKQPELVRDLATEAVEFVRKRDLLSVPPLCDETWRMTMIPPERQLVSPFFLGGEVVQIAYPTDSMPYDAKQQAMRGNNRHFSKATVHHELIPGHGLQQYWTARTNTHRVRFSTPFWTEGWALYMEFVLYDQGFPSSPEDRVGMLFWRMHRCARVVFSLGFHTGKLTPQQCIDYLVTKVGHERDNATAEVRRSFEGAYGPLYQVAYLIGGLQFDALRKEFVETGKMTAKEYHNAVMSHGNMPIEMVRSCLTKEKLTPNSILQWKFAAQSSSR
jgi:hypothetical protein